MWALSHGVLTCWKQPTEDGHTVVKKGWLRSATTGKLWFFKRCSLVWVQSVPREYSPDHHTTSSLSSKLNVVSDITTWLLEQKLKPIRPDNIFYFSIVQLWCSFIFLFLADRSGTQCGLSASSSSAAFSAVRKALLHSLAVITDYLTCCCLPVRSKVILLWPLLSTGHFHTENWDILCKCFFSSSFLASLRS